MREIPQYPEFRRLQSADRQAVKSITCRFLPYSDFGFTSLLAWDTDESCEISLLGDNLVVRLKDYQSPRHFLSFIGQDEVTKAAALLLEHARKEDLLAELRLVPEIVVAAEGHLAERYVVAVDQANDDYVYSVDDWANLGSRGARRHRRAVARCQELASIEARQLDWGDPASQQAMLELFDLWVLQTSAGVEADHERAALRRVFQELGNDHGRFVARGYFDGELLVGFSVWEGLADRDWAVIHFQKADRDYQGLSS